MAQPNKKNLNVDTAPVILIVAGFILILIVLIWQIYLSLTKDYHHNGNEPTETSTVVCQELIPSCLESTFVHFEARIIAFFENHPLAVVNSGQLEAGKIFPAFDRQKIKGSLFAKLIRMRPSAQGWEFASNNIA